MDEAGQGQNELGRPSGIQGDYVSTINVQAKAKIIYTVNAVCECVISFFLQICEGTSQFMVTLLYSYRSIYGAIHLPHLHP